MTQTTSRVLGNSLRFALDKESASRHAFERLQMVRSTDIDLGDWSYMTGPRMLPVLSLRGDTISQ
ncbi:hypothetical protein AtubIFM55763_003171 [Aspergillus tubingensis]|nr:hypothetical protein AtubIFM55763_003171 [Aspergillus tubingensis]